MLDALRSRLTYANVVASLALFIALGGSAVATHETIFSDDIVDGQVQRQDIANLAISKAKIAEGTISTSKYQSQSVTSSVLANPAVTSDDVAPNAVNGDKVADSSLTGAELFDGSVGADDLSTNSVGADEVSDNALTAGDLGTDSVGSDEVSDNSLFANDLGVEAVNTEELATNAVREPDIAPGAVKYYHLEGTSGGFSMGWSFIAANSCQSATWTDATIGAQDILWMEVEPWDEAEWNAKAIFWHVWTIDGALRIRVCNPTETNAIPVSGSIGGSFTYQALGVP